MAPAPESAAERGRVSVDRVSVFRTADDGSSQPVIEGLTLEVAPGECCMLVGPNGAGKTSLLLALVGALPFTGRIQLGDLVLGERTLKEARRRVGFVFANPDEQLFCESVEREVAFGPEQHGLAHDEVNARVGRALDAVGLRAYAARSPHHLSLGEQRRVAVAAALATEPDAVLFDEPSASLDPLARQALIDTMAASNRTMLVATHDLGLALELDATVALIHQGKLVGSGRARELLEDAELLIRAGLRAPGGARGSLL